MKLENFTDIAVADFTPNTPVYYALAASTSGNKVKIYRHAFERMNQEFHQRMLNATNPVDRAVAKYEWGEFILEQLPNYSTDRSEMFKGAKALIINAFSSLSCERYNAEQALKKAIKALEDFSRHAASASSVQGHNGDISSRAIENRKAELKGDITRRRKQYTNVMKRCPDHKFEHIKRRAEYCDSIW